LQHVETLTRLDIGATLARPSWLPSDLRLPKMPRTPEPGWSMSHSSARSMGLPPLRTGRLDRRGIVRATRNSCVFRRRFSIEIASLSCGHRKLPLVGWFVATPGTLDHRFLSLRSSRRALRATVLIRNAVMRSEGSGEVPAL